MAKGRAGPTRQLAMALPLRKAARREPDERRGSRGASQGHRVGGETGVASALALGGPPPLRPRPRCAARSCCPLGAVLATRAARLTVPERSEAGARAARQALVGRLSRP